MQKIAHFLSHISWISACLGMIALCCAALITVIDILLRKLAGSGIFGTIDLVQLCIITAAYLAIPFTFLKGGHVSVTALSDYFPAFLQGFCKLLAMILATILMSMIAYYGFLQAETQSEYGDLSMNLGLPMMYYWIPMIWGCVLAAMVTSFLAIQSLTGNYQNNLKEGG